MADFVSNNGFWTVDVLEDWAVKNNLPKPSPLINITVFEDGQKYVHDGHHRVASIFEGGRDFLRKDEYVEHSFVYSTYLESNRNAFENQFFTPFDPRIETRLPDFKAFKETALKMHQKGISEQELADWIRLNKSQYCCRRDNVRSISDLLDFSRR